MAALVRAVQGGERDAFAALYDRFARTVHGIVVAHGPWQQAEDLTQEVFVRVYERLGELRDPGAFPAFVCAAARNAATSALRRRAPRGGGDVPDVPSPHADPAVQAADRDAAAAVLDRIRALPEAYRETLTLRLVEGLGGEEIALRTGMTHGSVRVNLTRGMAMLRPLLAKAGLP